LRRPISGRFSFLLYILDAAHGGAGDIDVIWREKHMELAVTSVTLFCTIILLLHHISKHEEQNRLERKDLLDRIMARNYTEYKEQITEPIKYEPVTITEEDEYLREVEEQQKRGW
jgi:hypothetical protein